MGGGGATGRPLRLGFPEGSSRWGGGGGAFSRPPPVGPPPRVGGGGGGTRGIVADGKLCGGLLLLN